MPPDERSPAAADLSGAAWLELLATGEIEVEGRMPFSSNVTLLCTVSDATTTRRAIYKPARGERPLWDFPGGLCRREVAAYELSVELGLDVVPETVLREEGPFGDGSLQRFIEADFEQHYFTLRDDPAHLAALRRIAGFDLLANNADRKGGHLLLDASGAIWGIDNGLSFHPDRKLRTVMWDFAGDVLPDEILAACDALEASLPDSLASLLEPEESVALVRRAGWIRAEGSFPWPPADDRRAYPWPLV